MRKHKKFTRKHRTRKRVKKIKIQYGGIDERTYIFIIPFRARPPHEIRKEQVKRCIDSIVSCFTKHNKKFKIIIAEQNNDYPFNMALLKNVGFLEGEKKYTMSKVYLHMNADYYIDISKDFPKELDDFHEEGVLDIFTISKNDSDGYVGGCCCFNAESFIKINGFPNNLFGWGGDDTAFRYRLDTIGVKYMRNSLTNNGWIISSDDRAPRNTDNNGLNLKKATGDIISNGLNTCKYNIDGTGELNDQLRNINHILINFVYP
jgi:hypothetical protein